MLTEKQKETLEFIYTFHRDHGWPPSLREIAARFGITLKTTFDRILALERKGYIIQPAGKRRVMRINWHRVGFDAGGKAYERIPL